MKYLVIYAHPNPKSFNHAIKEAVEDNLKKAGATVVTRDLYALGFDPVLVSKDFVAMSKKEQQPDVATEQKYVKDADKLIIIHPIWWFGQPAILKGYIDRVFSKGFAYDYTDKGPVGLLNTKKVIILNTTGGPADNYEKFGFNTGLKATMDIGTYGFCGLTVEAHKFFYAIPTSSEAERKKILEDIGTMKF